MGLVATELFGDLAVAYLQAEVPAREVLEWKTDLITSYDGSESAQRVRAHPRQQFTYTVPEPMGTTRAQFLTQYGGLRQRWCVPLWMETQYVGAVVPGAVQLAVNTATYDYRNGSLGLLYQPGTGVWEVVEISTVQPNSLQLLHPTAQPFTAAWVVPARVAYVRDAIERNSRGHDASTSVTYEVDDLASLAPVVPPQYKGYDLYTTPTLFAGNAVKSRVSTRVDRIDYELGRVARRTPWLYNRVTRPNHVVCDGAAEVQQFRQWLARRCGRYRKYWEPTFEADLLNLSTGNVTTTLVVSSDTQMQWPLRPHLAIELVNGTWLAREVVSRVQLDSDRVQLVLSSTLATNASNIKRISFLGLKRLDTDRIEINWVGNSVLRASVNTVEVAP